MAAGTRWHVIPRTAGLCVLWLLIGLALAVQAVLVLSTSSVNQPALEVVVAVLGVILVGCSIAGLVSPRLRGR
ncbi:hypothetical protein QRX50_19075 [Amycolatopsis carbonis]|uniref:Uncharacterized protein n=1 Tax=Amycolatopsis carbonis TaxID=715471 RepID=A0A9Y2IQ66_9PSEU|nr:hypothetical protein [Amycolatopsis sp. 2-15]WIX82728.1 hypothetical protein QRX50_19075 [Amycolatopsis sp. 2-15]